MWHDAHMPKRIKQPKRPTDANQLAYHLETLPTGEIPDAVIPPTNAQISLVMAELGRKGGKIGGKRRLVTMTHEQRRIVALKAAKARWAKHKKSAE
jgi:hypothetical protein